MPVDGYITLRHLTSSLLLRQMKAGHLAVIAKFLAKYLFKIPLIHFEHLVKQGIKRFHPACSLYSLLFSPRRIKSFTSMVIIPFILEKAQFGLLTRPLLLLNFLLFLLQKVYYFENQSKKIL